MKNLKKVLALVLAFAMAFTMMATAGAAYTDQADIEATEAVDMLTTLGIMAGDPDGSFRPNDTITRAEACRMIYSIRTNSDNADNYADMQTTFKDVPADAWYAGYVKHCQAAGIVSGTSATTFEPNRDVTGVELALMCLRVMGYDPAKADIGGSTWSIKTIGLATEAGILDDVNTTITAACPRQWAAQLMYNAIQASTVEWSTDSNSYSQYFEDGSDRPSVGKEYLKLWIDVGTLTKIDGNDLTIAVNASDAADSDNKTVGNHNFTKVGKDYSSLLGQKVKVMYSDGKFNNVLGVYAIDDNNVVTVNQNAIDVDAGKIVIDGTSYTIETDGVTVIEDGKELSANWKAGEFKDERSADVITLIDTDDNNKIDTAYIKTVNVEKVTYVASSQIIAGSKTYKFAEDTIDENVQKDDWVIITKNLYNDNNDIVVAAKATGSVAATKTKGTSPNTWTQYQIGEEWFNESSSSTRDINTNVKPGVDAEYVAVNGILFYAVKTSAGANKLSDVLFVAYVGQDGLSNDQARVMFPNGDKATINLKNTYSTTQAGAKGAPIAAGQFYEYSKSGTTYELIDLATTDDFYGDFTYRGTTATLAATGDMTYAGVTKAIADSADVIVWTQDSTGNKVDFKHITGKQLKALIDTSNGGPKIALGNSNGQLSATLLGGFTSDVDGLNRASVLAVKYNSADGSLGTDFDNISSNANYGFITKDAVKLANGNIKFTVWTGSDNVEVVAEKSSERAFTKGTIVGYTDIQDKDGTNVMSDAVAITTGVTAGAITSVNSKGTKIESSTISLPAEDLDDYSTVLYVDSKAGTGMADGKAAAANSQKVNGQTYYATNLLVYGTEVAVIDVNEIAGSTYGASTLPATISGLTDVQWLNTRTNDTDEGAAYNGAIMQLSFYASQDGTLTLTNVSDIATNDNNGTVALTVKGGEYNKFDSLIVTGNVTATFTASGSTTPSTGEKITSLEFKPSWTFGDTSAANLDIVYENAVGKRPSYIIYKKGDSGKTNLVGSKFTAGTAFTLPPNNDAAAQTTTVTLAGADAGDYVLELTVGGATKTVEFTVANKIVTGTDIKLQTLAKPADSTPLTSAADNSGTGYTVGTTTWEVSDDGSTGWAAATGNGVSGKYYRATITLNAATNYTFTGSNITAVTLNGLTATSDYTLTASVDNGALKLVVTFVAAAV